jgi:hypothetical protein
MKHARKYAAKTEPTVKPILHLRQVAMGVFLELKPVVGPIDSGFQIAEDGAAPVKAAHGVTFANLSDNLRQMRAPCAFDSPETRQSVRDHPGCGCQ